MFTCDRSQITQEGVENYMRFLAVQWISGSLGVSRYTDGELDIHDMLWCEPWQDAGATTHHVCLVELQCIPRRLAPIVAANYRNNLNAGPDCDVSGITTSLVLSAMATSFQAWWSDPERGRPGPVLPGHDVDLEPPHIFDQA